MSSDLVVQMAREALFMVMLISAPMLGLGMLVGILVSVFQATTQIQEQTLTFVPKLIAIILVLVLGGPWMLNKLVMLTNELFQSISTIVN